MNAQIASFPPKAELLDLLTTTASETGVVGAQMSLVLGDETMDLACGLANAERREPMLPETILQIGSITKLLNAALTLSLVEEGRLALDRPIATYAPTLMLADGAQHEITLRQLLSMSAGLDNGPYSTRHGGGDTLDDYVGSLQDIPMAYQPGHGFGYSNAGICLAGYVAQWATAERWNDMLCSRVLLPCILDEWSLGADQMPFFRVSVGHEPASAAGVVPRVIRPWGFSAAQGPAGSSLAMSARTLARFGGLIAQGGGQGLSAWVVEEMTTPTARVPSPIPCMGVGDAWGLGPSRSHWDGHAVWSHAGGMRSARTLLACIPSRRAAIALAVNTPGAFLAFAGMLLNRVCPSVFGIAPSRQEQPRDELQTTDQLQRLVGTYLRFGTRYELSARNGRLHYEEFNLGVGLPGEKIGLAVACDCTRAGEDSYLFVMPGFAEPLPITFVGRDSQGRATSMVSALFPARRVM